jgi:hypothetical protein
MSSSYSISDVAISNLNSSAGWMVLTTLSGEGLNFWDIMCWILIYRYRCFGIACCLQQQVVEEGTTWNDGSTLLQDAGTKDIRYVRLPESQKLTDVITLSNAAHLFRWNIFLQHNSRVNWCFWPILVWVLNTPSQPLTNSPFYFPVPRLY